MRSLLLISCDPEITDEVADSIPEHYDLVTCGSVQAARMYLLRADEPDPDEVVPRMGEWVIAYGGDIVEDIHHGIGGAAEYPLDPGWGSTVVVVGKQILFGVFTAATQQFPDAPIFQLPGNGWVGLVHELQRPPGTTCHVQWDELWTANDTS